MTTKVPADGDPAQGSPAEAGPAVRRLLDLIEGQKGAIVSRQLIHRTTGSVTLFAFDAGEGLSEHTAPFDALVLGLEGEADVVIDKETYRLHAGETITLPAHHPHALRAPQPFKMLLVMVRG